MNREEQVNRIMDTFETFLDKHGIIIPSPYREGEPDEACLFGEAYYELKDMVKDCLAKF